MVPSERQPARADVHAPAVEAQRFWAEFGHGVAGHHAETSRLLAGYAGSRLRVGAFQHLPHTLSGERLPRAQRNAALLTLHLEGRAVVEHQGRCSELLPGDFCLIDLSRPFRVDMGQTRAQTVHLPLSVLREACPRMEQLAGLAIQGDGPSAGFLRGLFQQLFDTADLLTEPVADKLADAIPYMLAALAEAVELPMPPPSQMREHHKRQVRRFARENLGNADLCADMIGKAVGLSTSYLFELFADEELTLMRWVRRERLARCRRELADPALRHRSIAQIAQAWGFGDMTHFSRSFREVFGISPRAFRHAPSRAGVATQDLSAVQTSVESSSDRAV